MLNVPELVSSQERFPANILTAVQNTAACLLARQHTEFSRLTAREVFSRRKPTYHFPQRLTADDQPIHIILQLELV